MTHFSRQPSIASLDVSPNCLSNIAEHLEQGCDKILEFLCNKGSKQQIMRLDDQAKKILSDKIIRLIVALCSPNVPSTILSFSERIQNGLPGIESKLYVPPKTLEELRQVEKMKKKLFHLHNDKIYNVLKETYHRFDYGIYMYIVAVLDHLLQRFLQLAMDYQQRMGTHEVITGTALQTLLDVYWTNSKPVQHQTHLLEDFVKFFPTGYEACTKELQQFFLAQCIDQVNLILRIFRQPIVDVYPGTGDLQTIFGCVSDLNLTLRILRDSIDDVFESETSPRCIAYCFLSMGEEHSVDDFVNYGRTVLSPECSTRLHALLGNNELIKRIKVCSEEIKEKMKKAANKKDPEHRPWFHQCDLNCPTDENIGCDFLVNSFRYLLPRLLLLPILHFLCLQHILNLLEASPPSLTERDILREALSMMTAAKSQLDRELKSATLDRPSFHVKTEVRRLSFFIRTQQSSSHILQNAKSKLESIETMLKRSSENSERPSGRFEFIMEDILETRVNNKSGERYVYLFTTWLMVYKHKNNTLSFKKKIPLDQFNVLDIIPHDDREPTKEKNCQNSKFVFEIEYLDQKTYLTQKISFYASSYEQKCDWMATLLMIQTQKMFSRYLKELPSEEPELKLPDPSVYRFSEEDFKNIQLEDNSSENSNDIPYIKAATLPKLVERITFHRYFDSKMLRTFLLVFRSFTDPKQLLSLLIERFNIPEPTFTEEEKAEGNDRQILRRFNNTYKKRVQLRVLNALFHWVRDVAYYQTDFKDDETLQRTLSDFLLTVNERHLQNGVTNIRKHMDKDIQSSRNLKHVFDVNPPPIIGHILATDWERVSLINVHPLEFARQVTLYEWELYKNIEYFEVTASETTKPDKQPNLYKLQEFSNKFKNWLVYSVVSQDNLEDRVIVLQRIIDLMQYFDRLNNLQGFQEAKGAIISASVYRMHHTLEALCRENRHYRNQFEMIKRGLEDTNDMSTNEYHKKIRQIDPPAIPFIAIESKSRLIHINIKNSDYVVLEDGTQLINYRKFRMYGETVEYYLSFQKKPYNFCVEEKIRTFIEKLDPFELMAVTDENGFEDSVYEKSKQLEPKNVNLDDLAQYETSLSAVERDFAKHLSNTTPDEVLKTLTCNFEPKQNVGGSTFSINKTQFPQFISNTHPRSSSLSTSISTASSPSTLPRSQANTTSSSSDAGANGRSKHRTSSTTSGASSFRPSPSPVPKKQSSKSNLHRPETSPVPVSKPPPVHKYSKSDSNVTQAPTTSTSPPFGSSPIDRPPIPRRTRKMSTNSDASDPGFPLTTNTTSTALLLPPPLPPRKSTHVSPRITPPPSFQGSTLSGQDNSIFSVLDEQQSQPSGDSLPSSLPPRPPRQAPPLPPKPSR